MAATHFLHSLSSFLDQHDPERVKMRRATLALIVGSLVILSLCFTYLLNQRLKEEEEEEEDRDTRLDKAPELLFEQDHGRHVIITDPELFANEYEFRDRLQTLLRNRLRDQLRYRTFMNPPTLNGYNSDSDSDSSSGVSTPATSSSTDGKDWHEF